LKALKLSLITLFSLPPLNGASVSFVYNLKIAETTKRHAEEKSKYHFIGAATPIFQDRKKNNEVEQNAFGSLESLIYYRAPIYARVDFAFAHVWEQLEQFRFSRTLSDDILFTAGYSHSFTERIRSTLSGMVGIPTHKNVILEGIQFGTGHYGLGIQLDSAIQYALRWPHSLRLAYRCIHFLKRTLDGEIIGLDEKFKFTYGNLMDFFIAHHFNFDKNRFEIGYDFILLMGASIDPVPPIFSLLPDTTNYKRSSFFGTYQRLFAVGTHPSALILGLSYSFDNDPHALSLKRLITTWISLGINF
jgi:hypothetical protein